MIEKKLFQPRKGAFFYNSLNIKELVVFPLFLNAYTPKKSVKDSAFFFKNAIF